jgi:hypothetical protein
MSREISIQSCNYTVLYIPLSLYCSLLLRRDLENLLASVMERVEGYSKLLP